DPFHFRPKDAVDLLADLWWDRDLLNPLELRHLNRLLSCSTFCRWLEIPKSRVNTLPWWRSAVPPLPRCVADPLASPASSPFRDHLREAVFVGNSFVGNDICFDVMLPVRLNTKRFFDQSHRLLLVFLVQHPEHLEAFQAGLLAEFFDHLVDPDLELLSFLALGSHDGFIDAGFRDDCHVGVTAFFRGSVR